MTPDFPESQVEGSASYFDINADPGTTEKLTLTAKRDRCTGEGSDHPTYGVYQREWDR